MLDILFTRNDYGDYSQSFDIAVSPGVIGRTPKTNRTDRRQRRYRFNEIF